MSLKKKCVLIQFSHSSGPLYYSWGFHESCTVLCFASFYLAPLLVGELVDDSSLDLHFPDGK